MISYALNWYLVSLAISVAGFFIANHSLKFSDRGYGFSRVIGLIIVSYFSWIFNYLFNFTLSSTSLWLLVLLLALTASVALKKLSKNEIILILCEEVLFVVTFISMLLFRASMPEIKNIEKIMDFGIINGLVRGTTLPPVDIWFSGQSINYYYFGQYIASIMFKLTNTTSGISYNMYVAYNFATTIVAGFSLLLFLTKKYYISILGTLVLLVGGNLDFLYSKVVLKSAEYFYANARSLIPFTINEFPAYSFLIGDLHAHILNIQNVLLVLALIATISTSFISSKSKIFVMLLALSIGVLGATNS
jgi:uncharacterized membrane protein